VEDRIEEYKESISRADLLRLADEVVEELRVNGTGQYQLTELLLCTAVDRKIFRLLKLPGYRVWCGTRTGPPTVEGLEVARSGTELRLPQPVYRGPAGVEKPEDAAACVHGRG
jgi:hypothetical protein